MIEAAWGATGSPPMRERLVLYSSATGFAPTVGRVSRAEQFWGAASGGREDEAVDRMFPGAPTTTPPWPQAGRRKDVKDYDEGIVHAMLAKPPELSHVDPRTLSATQPAITRAGVRYYLGRQFNDTGKTFADQGNVGNIHPVVYHREGGTSMLLSGHHRAAAALLRGEPLVVREVRGPWGPPR